ncbi:lipase 1-like [Ctenocephalides felis]|uniref:lipase 1-like n=1 Tax=Ctenocephalides felis TaxID=7515 RepID=UPI000E6E54C1|nr:lipase 1-like [Ctenocephalides felis]
MVFLFNNIWRILFIYAVFEVSQAVNHEQYSGKSLIHKKGYEHEEYKFISKDGYTITLDRMPNPGLEPILLVPGMLQSSSAFLIQGRRRCLGSILQDNDYDVWIMNPRGSYKSRDHVKYNAERDFEYWDFTIHEQAIYDIPGALDTITNITHKRFVNYIGHSQGATLALIYFSEFPTHTKNIGTTLLLAPIIGWPERTQEEADLLKILYNELVNHSEKRDLNDQFHAKSWYGKMIRSFCRAYRKKPSGFCEIFRFIVPGYNRCDKDIPVSEEFLDSMPAGVSFRQVLHYMQIYMSGQLQGFDYGPEGNMEKYKQPEPPVYDAGHAKNELSVFYSEDDNICAHDSVHDMFVDMRGLKDIVLVDGDHFTHNDFLWSPEAYEEVYMEVLWELSGLIHKIQSYMAMSSTVEFESDESDESSDESDEDDSHQPKEKRAHQPGHDHSHEKNDDHGHQPDKTSS